LLIDAISRCDAEGTNRERRLLLLRNKHKCLDCNHLFNDDGIHTDGTCCPLCEGPAPAIGYADSALDKQDTESIIANALIAAGAIIRARIMKLKASFNPPERPIFPKPPIRKTDYIGKEKLKIIVNDNDEMTVYMDGKEVMGIMSITFNKSMKTTAEHCIVYRSCRAGVSDG
jgi:hypothetical protein